MVIMALFLSPTFATSFNKKTMRKSMITLNRKWIRLIGIVGCTMCLASCKQASDASGMKPSYNGGNNDPASVRDDDYPTSSYDYDGFRVALYM